MSSTPRIRVFVSSPGDAAEERVLANNLVRRLADQFADRAWVEPVFWEHEPLLASDTFQSQIPLPSECDVVVCILWARLGTRLPANITRPDGTTYASGTEYEFENAIEGRRRNGKPDLLVYRKTARPVIDLNDEAAVLQRLAQKKALDAFIQKWFLNETDGSLKAAFHQFETSARFEEILEEHLRKLIRRRLPDIAPGAAAAQATWKRGSPFRGLEVFDFEHAAVFFGRTAAIGEVVNCLRQQIAVGRAFVLVTGVSGGGKSSLVRAGVVPLLTQPGVIEGVAAWRRAVLRPADGADVFASLAAALLHADALPELAADGVTLAHLANLLRESPLAAVTPILAVLARAGASGAGEVRLVVVIDQLEELFTVAVITADVRARFVAALGALAQSGKVAVLATLRSDFYHRCAELPGLVALKEGHGQYDLLPPTPAEIGQMIRRPAQAAGLTFEEDAATGATLDDTLRDAAAANPESLPLLEFTLEQLYLRKTPENRLTFDAYRQLGGVEGALATHAERAYAARPADEQAALPAVFRGLVTVGEGAAGVTRKQAKLSDLARTPAARGLVDALVAARLLTADRTPQGDAVVRVAHEALLRSWPRLVAWLEQDRQLLRTRARVSAAAGRWQGEGRRADLLLPAGTQLDEAKRLLANMGDELSPDERALIAASAAQQATRTRLRRTAVAALVVLTVLSVIASIYANHQRGRARENEQRSQKNEQLAKSSAEQAKQSEAEAQRQFAEGLVREGDALALAGRPAESKSRYALAYEKLGALGLPTFAADLGNWAMETLSPPPLMTMRDPKAIRDGQPVQIAAVVVTADGRTALAACEDNVVRVWDVRTGRQLRALAGHTAPVKSVAVTQDGATAVSAGDDKVIRIWDVATGKQTGTLEGHAKEVNAVALTPDDARVISASDDNTLKAWDLKTKKEVWTLKDGDLPISGVAIAPDGKSALDWGGDGFTLWNLETGKPIKKIPSPHGGLIGSATFSGDGERVLSGAYDRSLLLWEISTGKVLRSFVGHTNSVIGVALINDGVGLSASTDNTLKLWNLEGGGEICTFTGHTNMVSGVGVSEDGRTAVSCGWDGNLMLWDLQVGNRASRILTFQSASIESVAVSPDGRLILAAGDDKAVVLADVATGNEIRSFAGHTARVTALAFSPDGRLGLSASDDKTLKLWDLASGKLVRALTGHADAVCACAVSPNGRTALSGGEDKSMRLWDLGTGKEIRSFTGHAERVDAVAFSPDGQTALSGSWDNTIKLWDVNSGKEIRTLKGHTKLVTGVAFMPDGQAALSSSEDETLKLWNLATGKEIRSFLGHTGSVSGVGRTPDARFAISAAWDHTVRLWDVGTGNEVRTIATLAEAVNAVAFGPDGLVAFAAGSDQVARAWDFSRPAKFRGIGPAFERATRTVVERPEDAAALGALADWYALRGLDDWAAEFFEKAIGKGATVAPLTLGRSYWLSGDETKALAEFRKAAAATKDEAERFYLQLCIGALERATAPPP